MHFTSSHVLLQKLYRWSEMTLNYWMIVERYPNLKDEVGGSIPGFEIVSLLDRNLRGGQALPYVKIKK